MDFRVHQARVPIRLTTFYHADFADHLFLDAEETPEETLIHLGGVRTVRKADSYPMAKLQTGT